MRCFFYIYGTNEMLGLCTFIVAPASRNFTDNDPLSPLFKESSVHVSLCTFEKPFTVLVIYRCNNLQPRKYKYYWALFKETSLR